MQQKLFLFKPKLTGYVCLNCELDPNNVPDGVQARYVKKKLRAMLEEVTCNVYRCPNCSTQHYHKQFLGQK